MKRTESGDGYRYRKQIEYFAEKHCEKLAEMGYYAEIQRFLQARTFFQKLQYALTGHLYRQKKIESIAFYCAVLLGRY